MISRVLKRLSRSAGSAKEVESMAAGKGSAKPAVDAAGPAEAILIDEPRNPDGRKEDGSGVRG